MRGVSNLLTATLAITGAAANSWFPGTRGLYNKWHETELERWLSDYNIPHPGAADRKDFQSFVEKNWNDYITEPYKKWDREQLSAFLKSRGQDIKDDASDTLDDLMAKAKASWYTAEKNTAEASGEAKDWIFDSWSDSQLKAFCDRNGVPVPNPRHRDTLIQKSRLAYSNAAKKLDEAASYPGDWLYESWSDSDLKNWLDTHGYANPQVTERNKLISQVRRNSYMAHLKYQDGLSKAKDQARSIYASLTDNVLDTWSESQLKKFCDKNGISVPQGTKVNELRALIRKHRAEAMGTDASGQASKAFGAATSNVEQKYAQATDSASLAAQHAFEQASGKWSESRLKSYLDARGIPVPQKSSVDELRALVRKNAHKASTGWTAWTFDDFDRTNIQNYLLKHGNAAAKKAAKKKDATRDELVSAAQSAYSSASTAGGQQYADATSYLAAAATSVRKTAFDEWSESELKAYLDSYGIPVPQGTKIDELKALARKQATYFRYGTSSPGGTFAAKVEEALSDGWDWVSKQFRVGSEEAKKQAGQAEEAAAKQAEKLREEL